MRKFGFVFASLKRPCLDQQGQTLVEAVVALVATILVVTALAIIATNAIRNAQFAKNEAKANELAEKTLEEVRIVREQKGWSGTTGFSSYDSTGNKCFTVLEDWSLEKLGNDCTPPPAELQCLADFPTPLGDFHQRLTLSDPAPADNNRRIVDVAICWQDLTGSHIIKSSTVLSKWQ